MRAGLLHFEVVATSVGTAMSVGGVISGILGMNLRTSLFQRDEWLFNAVSIGIGLLCLGTFGVLWWLQRGWGGGVDLLRRAPMATSGVDPASPLSREEARALERPVSDRPPTWQHAPSSAPAAVRDSTYGASHAHSRAWE